MAPRLRKDDVQRRLREMQEEAKRKRENAKQGRSLGNKPPPAGKQGGRIKKSGEPPGKQVSRAMPFSKVQYRYTDGAKPGDERRALPVDGDPYNLRVLPKSSYPKQGDVRYEVNPKDNSIIELRSGERSPLTGNLGWTKKELEAYYSHIERENKDRRRRANEAYERRQERYKKEQRQQEAANKDKSVAERVNDVAVGYGAEGFLASSLASQSMDDKSLFARTIDVLSRPLFGVTNVLDEGLTEMKDQYNQGRVVNPRLNPFTSGVASPMASAFWDGFSGKKKSYTSDLLVKHMGADPESKWTFAAGLGGDILLDPLTFTPSKFVTAPARATKNLFTKSSKLDSPVTRLAQGAQRAPASPLFDGPASPSMLDDIVRKDIPIAQRIKAVDDLMDATVRPIVMQKSQERLREKLHEFVQRGAINSDELEEVVRKYGTPDLRAAISSVTSKAYRKARHVDIEDVTGKPKVNANVPGRVATVQRAGAKRIANAMRIRAQLSARSTARGQRRRPLTATDEARMGVQSDLIGDLGPTAARAREALTEARGAAGAVFRAQQHAARRAGDNASQFERIRNTGSGSQQSLKGATSVVAAGEKNWMSKFMQTFGRETNAVQDDIRNIATSYIEEVGARPIRANYASDAEHFIASVDWHEGLYHAVENTVARQVNDAVADQMLRISDEATLARFAQLGEEAGEELLTPISNEALTSWGATWPRFSRSHPKAFDDVMREVGEEAAQMEEALKLQMYEVVAMSDRLPLPENISIRISSDGRLETNLGNNWDDFINFRNEAQIPELAAKSYNNTFARLFSAGYGQDKAFEEMARRWMGNSNVLIAQDIKALKQSPLAKTSRGRRKREFKELRENGIISDNMAYVMKEIEEFILPVYSDVDRFTVPFGSAGMPNIGDLNRWLNKSNFKFEATPLKGGGRKFDTDWIKNLPDDTDPLEFLHQLKIANDKVIVEKATLNSISDTFGVPNSSAAATEALKRNGYVTNERIFGDQVLFHPEVNRQIDHLWDLTHRADPYNNVMGSIMKVQDLWRQIVTIYNPVGFNVRNLIGDAFKNTIVEGVTPASNAQAMSLMRGMKQLDPDVARQLSSPNIRLEEALEAIPNPRRNFIQGPDGQFFSMEEVIANYNRYGLSPTQVSATMGVLERSPSANVLRRGVADPLQSLAENVSQFGRLSMYVHALKKTGSWEKAAEKVRRVHYDYNHMTQFEKVTMASVIPFYRYLRNNYPYMAGILFTKPGRATIPDKALRNWSTSEGFDVEDGVPYTGFPIPKWMMNRSMWPIVEHDGGVLFANPDYELNSTIRELGEGPLGWSKSSISPFILGGSQAITGREIGFEGKIDYDAPKDRNALKSFMSSLPQLRAYYQIKEGPGPGRWGQLAGFSSADVTPGTAMREFYMTDEMQKLMDEKDKEKKKRGDKNLRVQRSIAERDANLSRLLELLRGK